MRSIAVIAVIAGFFAWGCSDEYFADGGVPGEDVGVLGVSTMDYLESHPEKFDTLATLIKLCGLEGEVNKQGNTFLAPQDYSIHNYFQLVFSDGSAWPALSEIPEEQMEEITGILKNYIIPGQEIVSSGLTTAYSYSVTHGGRKARFNLVKEDYIGNVNMGAAYVVFSLDVSREGSSSELYQAVPVVTSGLRSLNGVVHVLRADTHIFGFN